MLHLNILACRYTKGVILDGKIYNRHCVIELYVVSYQSMFQNMLCDSKPLNHWVSYNKTFKKDLYFKGSRPVDTKCYRVIAVMSSVVITLLAGGSRVVGQQSSEIQVTAVVDAFHAALAAGDSVTALRHLAPDVTILESGGIEDKEHYRSGHLVADMRFAQAMPRERGEIQVKLLGDVAWAYSTSITQGRIGDREINSQGAELMVLAREDGAWKIKAIHWSSRQRR